MSSRPEVETVDLDPDRLPGTGRLIVAFSGGPDSVCLLHRLVRADTGRKLVCVHIDHGLDADSPKRAERAVAIAARLGLDCRVIRVTVGTGRGVEAEARQARYRALAGLVGTDDVLLTAHHADDQVETVLLRLLRGAGPAGLAGIPRRRRFGRGWLVRPLLDWRRDDIEAWLERHGLPCIRDPANESPDFDRNHLRQRVLPALRERWPGVDAAVLRSAALCRGAADLIARQAAEDLAGAILADGSLALARLDDDGDYYRGEIIRAWCLQQGVEPPPGRQLDDFLGQLSTAADDRCPELSWSGAVLRRWRERLWLEVDAPPPGRWALPWDGQAPLELPADLGTLRLKGPAAPPLALSVRSGGEAEAMQPAGHAHRRASKRLLADAGVPPWQRPLWPRLWLDGQLVALGARWLSAEFKDLLRRRGQELVWQPGRRAMVKSGP